jgi:hypothetical protein
MADGRVAPFLAGTVDVDNQIVPPDFEHDLDLSASDDDYREVQRPDKRRRGSGAEEGGDNDDLENKVLRALNRQI